MFTKKIGLTVLLKPSPPQISPSSPVATEGLPVNLTCSSTGGSPPPQIKWYKEGESQLLGSSLFLGETKDEPSTSVLNIIPERRDDGATYHCTVWNRALGQRQKLETRARLSVNCKFINVATTFCLKWRLELRFSFRLPSCDNWTVQPSENRARGHGHYDMPGKTFIF